MECDSKIAKLSEMEINKILAEVRKRRRKGIQSENGEKEEERYESPDSVK